MQGEVVGEFVAKFPNFRLANAEVVTWSGGQVRGRTSLRLVLG